MTKMMTLLEKNSNLKDIPASISTLPGDVAFKASDLIMFVGQQITAVLYDTGYDDILVTACKATRDLPFYVAMNTKTLGHLNEEDMILLSAVVLLPENLPYELSVGKEAFVMYDDWDFHRFDTMEEVVTEVEATVKIYSESRINDFAIMSGVELFQRSKRALIRRVEVWKDQMD